jgi:hypothetical protein
LEDLEQFLRDAAGEGTTPAKRLLLLIAQILHDKPEIRIVAEKAMQDWLAGQEVFAERLRDEFSERMLREIDLCQRNVKR